MLSNIQPSSAQGWSFLIVRSERGEKVVHQLLRKKKIELEETNTKAIMSGQAGTMHYKKYGSFAFARVRKLFLKKAPAYLEKPERFIPPRYYTGAFVLFTVTTLFNCIFFLNALQTLSYAMICILPSLHILNTCRI